MSQLLIRLESELVSTVDPAGRAQLTAQIAANLARLGCFDEANARIASLREVYSDGRSGPVTAWIMLAEGLIHLYRDLSVAALDRLARANLLGLAMGYKELVTVASAWKAHAEFELSKFPEMFKSLQTAINHSSTESHDAHTRIAMVLSNCYMLSGDRKNAQAWFMRGREHAVKNGDQASVEALLYNRSAFGLAALRLRNCDRPASAEELQMTRSELKSSWNLQGLTQITALKNHIHLAEARLLMLEGRYASAIVQLEVVRNMTPFANHNFSQDLIDLEICFCRFSIGERDEAFAVYGSLDQSTFSTLDLDEQAVAEWMRWKLAEADARFGSPSDYRQHYDDLQGQHQAFAEELAGDLRKIVHR